MIAAVTPHLPTISIEEVVGRVAIAIALGAVVGLERQARERSAGLRTHILVSLGAASFTIISAYGFHDAYTQVVAQGGTAYRGDPGRIAAQIVSGVGFLGGGVILRSGLNVRGLTTAASVWATAAIGMAIGAGMYTLGIVTAVGILFVLVVLRGVNALMHERYHHDEVRFRVRVSSTRSLDDVLAQVRTACTDIGSMAVEPVDIESGEEFVTFDVELKAGLDKLDVSRELARLPGVVEVHMRDISGD